MRFILLYALPINDVNKAAPYWVVLVMGLLCIAGWV